MKLEKWRFIEGYEGLYQVSNNGKVKSVARMVRVKEGKYRPVEDRLINIGISATGYAKVTLSRNASQRTFLLHRVVAMAFISNPGNKEQVNHKDGDKENNAAENLEWNTQEENMRHAFKTGLKKGSGKTVEVLNPDTFELYPSIKVAAKSQGMTYARLRGEFNGIYTRTTNLEIPEFKIHLIHHHKQTEKLI